MATIGRLKGKGKLKYPNVEFEVDYDIPIRNSGGVKSGDGIVRGNETKILRAGFDTQEATLVLASGETVNLLLRETTSGGTINVAINGRIPGY